MTIVIRTLLITIKRIRIDPAAGVPVVFLVRRQSVGQAQFGGTQGIIPDGTVRIRRQRPAQQALNFSLVAAAPVLPVFQVAGGRFRVVRASGIPVPFR